MKIIAKFEGGVAERHILPAFEGSQSIDGLSRALTLTSHYLVTGTVRKKYPFNNMARIYIHPPREGSFEAIYSLFTDKDTVATTTLYGTVAVGVFGAFLKDAIELIFKRIIGSDHKPKTDQLKNLLANRAGELEALGEAVQPSLIRAHSVINHGAGSINIISGSNNIITFNDRSKRYLTTKVEDPTLRQKIVSCGMLNVNTRNGRIFDIELERTVPIRVPREASPNTLSALAGSLQRYSSKKFGISGSEVSISYTIEADQDGVVKRYIVFDAQEVRP